MMRDNLKKIRKNHGLSVEEIASELNISKSFYYKIESGIRNPTIFLAKRIAKFFRVEIEELF